MFRFFQIPPFRSGICTVVALVAGLAMATPPAAESSGPHCVTLGWTATGDDDYTGTATFYDIRYSTSYLSEQDWETANRYVYPPGPRPSGSRQEVTITGLQSSTIYYFAVKAADEHFNWSPISNIAATTTAEDICLGTTGNVDCDPDDEITISDLVALVDYCFMVAPGVCVCLEEANTTGDPNGHVDISDVVALVEYLFLGGASMPPCP